MKTIKIGKNTFELADSIINDLKASENLGLLKCIQCGMCTSVCPAASHTDYDPRVIVKRVLDEDDSLISDDIIWNCFYCYSCHSVCPVNNSVCEINQILRQKSIEKAEGIRKIASFLAYGDSFLELGIGSIPNDFFNELIKDIGEEYFELKIHLDDIREELGLGTIILPENDLNDIKKILNKTGFTDRLTKIRRVKKDEEDTR
jgi:heterodisulfide reductase subunit C